MKQVPFAMLLFAVAGCSESPPTCKQAVASLEEHMAGTGLRVYITASQCEADNYSGTVRKYLSIARSQHALEKCANAQLQNCITDARGREIMLEQCKSIT